MVSPGSSLHNVQVSTSCRNCQYFCCVVYRVSSAKLSPFDEPREPVRSCQTPRPPPLDLPSLRESASLGGRIRPFPAFTHPRNQVVCIHSSVLLFSLHPLSKVASHKQGQNQNPKIQKQKKAKRAMGREIPQGLDKVTAASQSQNQ